MEAIETCELCFPCRIDFAHVYKKDVSLFRVAISNQLGRYSGRAPSPAIPRHSSRASLPANASRGRWIPIMKAFGFPIAQ
jgi:hypothetical protein